MRKYLDRPHINPGWLDRPGAPGTTGPGGCAWSSIGPTNINGRITGIAIDANNDQNVYVTSVGGIWRSRDGGRRWQRVSDDFLATVFASIAVNPGDSNEIFAGAGDPNYSSGGALGIWRSTSAGAPGSWSNVSGTTFSGQVIHRLRIDPSAPHDVYAATSAGVYIGTHSMGTITWSRLASFDAWTSDIAVDFSASPRKVYAGVRQGSTSFAKGIWKYDGTSWQKKDSGIPTTNSRQIALALATSNPGVLYAKVENGSNGMLQGVYKTTTAGEPPMGGGNAWLNLPAASMLDDSVFPSSFCPPGVPICGYSWYNSVIEVDPTDPNIVLGAGLSIYRTTNGGTNWTNIGGGADPNYPYGVHADQHAISFDPTNPKLVLLGNDGGIDKSTDMSLTTWHWTKLSHGMVITEFYRMTSQQAMVTLVAGGSQDNGTEITYGNRTWYNPGGCDGKDAAVDGQNSSTLYANCNGGLYEFANPVPGTPGGGNTITWAMPTGYTPASPVVTDLAAAGAALMASSTVVSAGPPPISAQRLVKTTDGVNWNFASPLAPNSASISFIAIAPSSSFQTYYVGVVGGANPPTIWRTTNGGTTWNTTTNGLPNSWPTAAAIDWTNPLRAVATFGGGGVYLSTDGGANWNSIAGSGPTALPAIWMTGVVIDPNDSNVLYVSTGVGVFRGQITPGLPPTGSWAPFDEGLPDGLNVTGIWVNKVNGILTISSYGHGAFQRDIRPGVTCPGAFLLARDNIFDRGVTPSPSNLPDPEHPIPDPARPNFFKPDDTPAGWVFWWTSDDIRVDVPVNDLPKNTIASADHVEVESCPVEINSCPAGTVMDSNPKRGQQAKVYVQVTNRGLQPASNIRVIALWADATAGLPLLPNDFWTNTFPAGTTACGPLDTSTGWNLADPANPCRVIPVVNPDLPEVTQFLWSVPPSAKDHSCMLAIFESANDPIDPGVRSTNERQLWVLVPNNRQIALRNLHVVDSSAPGAPVRGSEEINLPNPDKERQAIDILISRAGMIRGARLVLLFPKMGPAKLEGLHPIVPRLNAGEQRRAKEFGLDVTRGFEVVRPAAAIYGLPVPSGKTWRALIQYDTGPFSRPGTASRFTILARSGNSLLGGSTYVLRVLSEKRSVVKAVE
jgi:photosystem II stability/assembly factor-like uncharacterized protein